MSTTTRWPVPTATRGLRRGSVSTGALVPASGPTEHFGSAALGLTLERQTAGFKTTTSTATFPITVDRVVAGFKTTTSSVATPLSLNVSTAGFKTTTSSVALPLTLTIFTAGDIVVVGGTPTRLLLGVGA